MAHTKDLMMNLLTLGVLGLTLGTAEADVVLSRQIMKLVKVGAELSSLAYQEDIPEDDKNVYQGFAFYDDEPDQALVVKTEDGYCFGAFRGTTLKWVDWKQNFDPGKTEVCVDIKGEEYCCSTRSGFYDAYHTTYDKDLETAIRECAQTCVNPDECVVLTGHSQGGAVAAVAGLVMADLNPFVITFGQPPTIDAPCNTVSSHRWYRFINTKSSDTLGITYDPVSFVPGLGADFFGHMIILSDDGSGVAYIGLDSQEYFSPLDVAGFAAHSMVGKANSTAPGYLDRIKTLMANDTYPIRNNGYTSGSLCTQDQECESKMCGAETSVALYRCIGTVCTEDKDCNQTGRCDSGLCISKLGSCQDCDEDSDCLGTKCLLYSCSSSSNDKGLMSDQCICRNDQDCESGRCEGLVPPICEAKLALGVSCNEDSDCISDLCSWDFICEENKKEDEQEQEQEEALTGFVPVVMGRSIDSAQNNYAYSNSTHRLSGGTVALMVVAVVVSVATVAYFTVPRLVARYKGYEDVPTSLTV